MQVPLQIAFRDVGQSDALAADIRKQAARLDRFCDHIVSCRVALASVAAHKQQGRLYEVHINVRVPGEELAATQKANEDAYVAIRDAFDVAQRQLEEFVRRQRGKVKRHAQA